MVGQYSVVFLVGILAGRFSTSVIYRETNSIALGFPWHSCPSCKEGVAVKVPLTFKCPRCFAPLKLSPWVELLMGSLYVLGNSKFGFSSLFFVYMAFVSVLLIISAVDLQTHNVPDALIITGIALGWMAGTFLTTSGIRDSTIGLLIGGGGFLSVAVATNGKLGGGDVKLAAMIGAILGWKAALTGFAIGIAAGSATGAVLLALKRVKRNTPIPFTPFLSAGSIVAIMKGREIMNWYIGRFQP